MSKPMRGSGSRLSAHASSLRASLLASLGVASVACGGSAVTVPGSDNGGASGVAGTLSFSGMPSGGTLNFAGAPGYGGSFILAGGPSIAGASNLAGSGGSAPAQCAHPVRDPLTGLVKCDNGIVHRPSPMACSYAQGGQGHGGAGGATQVSEAGAAGETNPPGQPRMCRTNADCAGVPLGYCDLSLVGICESGCTSDADCNGGVCVCDGVTPGKCAAAPGCRVDADCGAGALCAEVSEICGGVEFACTRPDDECLQNSDCMPYGTCTIQNGHRKCESVACGRPFLVLDQARTAPVVMRSDWLELELAPSLDGLSPVQRAELAAHWARLGQMEHASIAAFARFNLQLLALGAPAQLVEACNRALSDETAHARICFSFASHYAGTTLGPDKLELRDCFAECDLGAVLKLVLREGCIGETVAALDALSDAESASDPVIERALRRIARDEQNHAELAYRFMAWGLTQVSAELRAELVREAEARLDSCPSFAAEEVIRPLFQALYLTPGSKVVS